MAVWAPHYRLTAIGHLGPSDETFSYGVNLRDVGGAPADGRLTPENWLDVAEATRDFHNASDSHISPRAVLDQVKIARIGTDGTYAEPTPLVFPFNTPGGGGNEAVLPQAALAVSLTCLPLVGPRYRGRFYLPLPVTLFDVEDDFLIIPTHADDVLGQAAQWLQAINDDTHPASTFQAQVVIASSFGTNTDVSGVRVGRLIDTMQSRRKSLTEHYTATTTITS